jgi:hypothetical protein
LLKAFCRLLPLLLAFASAPAFAESWIQPTPDELKMTAEPAVPGAPAIYLYRDERADDKIHVHTLYVRLKVLTEEGKEYADVELGYDQSRSFSIRSIEGRTIHSDGTIIPFTGKPYDKLIEKTKTLKYKAKVFTLPDVQVGSILEYRYVLSYDDNLVVAPQWYIQLPLYVRKGHYEFIPSDRSIMDDHGGSMAQGQLAYSPMLPKGAAVQYNAALRNYTLDIEKIEPIPDEEFMPPMHSLSYRVLFYYTASRTAEDYWKVEGKYWSKEADKFIDSGKLGGIVAQIVAPSDPPHEKVRKIYDAVMKLDNTSFTRGHSSAEDKAQGIKIKTAADIWNAKRGNDDEITLLFVGLVRAAGLKAWLAAVANRDNSFFIPNYLSMSQLDDDIAIVELDGKEQFFDPGQRYCALGDLHWKHTATQGLRQTANGTQLFTTPNPGYKATSIIRTADIQIDPDGKVHGTIRVSMTGNRALAWRQRALGTDEDEIKREFEGTIQQEVPAGVEVKVTHFLSLDDYEKVLMCVLDVTGSMGTATSKRVFLPAMFFENGSKPLFVHDKRTVPVDLKYPYGAKDTVLLRLPSSMAIESAPKDAAIPLPNNAAYQVTFKQQPGTLEVSRVFILANSSYMPDAYPNLKDFYQKVNAKDQEQAILQPAANSAPKPSGGGAQ